MGKPKVDKTTLEYLTANLFHKESIIGFQFTAGLSPKGKNDGKTEFSMHCSLNKDSTNCVIDCSETDIGDIILLTIFPNKGYYKHGYNPITVEEMKTLADEFVKLGYEYESAEFAGEWHWFRVKCKYNEICQHVNNLKQIKL